MEILQLVGFGVASALLALTLRQTRPEMALLVSMVAGLCLFSAVLGRIEPIIESFSQLANQAHLQGTALPLLLRIIGVAALCELGAHLCRDAGESGIAAKIEMGGKIVVLAMAMPIATSLVRLVTEILP